MTQRYLMGLDIGGGGGRCLLVEIESGAVASAFRPWRFAPARDGSGLGADADVELLFARLCEASRETLARAGAAPDQVLGVAATSMRFGLVVADREGRSLYAGPNRDARAMAESTRFAQECGEELGRRTGHWPMPISAAARLRWLAEHDPGAWKRAHRFFSLNDWVSHRLCGAFATDPSQAGVTLLFELDSCSWARDLAERLEIPERLLPEVRPAGARLGELRADAARALGLRAGTPVAMGGADTQCGLLGAGAVAHGDFAVVAGTTCPVEVVLERPVVDPGCRLWAAPHVLPGRWVLESSSGPFGESLAWFAGMLYPDSPQPVASLMADAAGSPPGATGLLSTLGGQVMNARTQTLPMATLTFSHLSGADDPERRRHLARAVLEGMTYGVRGNRDQLAQVTGLELRSIHLAGGVSRSPTFGQLLSDVCGLPVDVARTPEATALGAAICAGVGAGLFADLETGAKQLAPIGRTHRPDRARTAAYDPLFSGWLQLRAARADSDNLAIGLMMQGVARAVQASAGRRAAARPRILVTAALDEDALDSLRALGDVEYASYREKKRILKEDTLREALRGFQIFVTEIDLVDAKSVALLPELRAVVSCRGNAVNVDAEACGMLGVPVLNAPGRNADAVADLTLAFLLMLARKLPAAEASLRQRGVVAGDLRSMGAALGSLQGRELWRKAIGLVGLGAVGRAVARRARTFGARVLVFDPFVEAEQALGAGAEPVGLSELLEASDFVSLHAAVTPETRGMIGAGELARMKRGACLVNTARAALVDEDALLAALRSGQLGGAALDVFSVEPPGADHPLLALPNVIATPHVGGNTVEVSAHQGRIVVEDLARLLQGERPRHLLNPEALERLDWSQPRPAVAPDVVAELAKRPPPAITDLQKEGKSRAL